MKKKLCSFALILAFFLFCAGKNDNNPQESSQIKLVKVKNYKEVSDIEHSYRESNFKNIKARDIKMYYYETDSGYIWYSYLFFHDYSGKMDCYNGARHGNSKIFYNEVSSSWINDTIVAVKMINTTTRDTMQFKMWGNSQFSNNKLIKRTCGQINP